LQRYCADKFFVGIDSISVKNGLSAASEKEAEITMAIARNARETFFFVIRVNYKKTDISPLLRLILYRI
jgi:DeoR family fructose operon transcriptional repressor